MGSFDTFALEMPARHFGYLFHAGAVWIKDGLICVVQLGTGNQGGILAFDLATGAEKWRWTGDGAAYASPALLVADGEKLVVAQTDTKMVAVTLAAGKLVWETPFAVQGRGYNAVSPIVDGATLIYAGSGRGMGGGGGYGSVVDAGAVLMGLTPGSELVVFEPDAKAFKEVARIKVASSPTHAYPVVSSKGVYIKDRDSLALLTVE